MTMTLSIMITTLNREGELSRTLERLKALRPAPTEVWVVADGCTDRTVELVRESYPDVRLIVHEKSQGSVASRAEVMAHVGSDLVLALDDDSYPEQDDCLPRIAKLFEKWPDLGIATFPQRTDEYPDTLKQIDFGVAHPIRSFPNSGACLRVSIYRSLPGFEPMFFHMYEEPDYALQCVANGWKLLFYPDITIRHHWTPNQRSEMRNHHRHARNELWSTLMRCPFPYLLALIPYRVLSQARFALSRGLSWFVREPVWWWQALLGVPKALRRRTPVSWKGYRKWMSLPDQ